MAIGTKIDVNFQSVKEAVNATEKLKQRLTDVGSMDVNVHTRMDATHVGAQQQAAQYSRTVQQSIDRLIKGSSGSISTGANGQKIYTSPTGVQYGMGGGGGGAPTPPANMTTGATGGNAAWTAMKYGAALIGGFSIMNFLHESMSQAASINSNESNIRAMGGKNFRHKGAAYGYMPEESMAMQETIMRKTGFQKDYLDSVSSIAARYGRITGLGGERVAQYIGGTFATTAAGKENTEKQLKLLRDTAVALGARGRIEEVLATNQSIMQTIVSGRGGGNLSDAERTSLTAMQMALWDTKGQAWKGQSGANNLASLSHGIASGGGDPGTSMFIAKALGVDNVRTPKDLWEFNKRKQSGATFQNVKALLDLSDKMAKEAGLSPEDAQYAAMSAVAELGLKNVPVEGLFGPKFRNQLDEINNDPKRAMEQIQESDIAKARLAGANKDAKANLNNPHRKTVAAMANFKGDLGEKLLPYVDKFKDQGMKAAKLFEQGDVVGGMQAFLEDNPIGQAMAAAGVLGAATKLPSVVPVPGKLKGTPGGPLPLGKVIAGGTAVAQTMRAGEAGVRGEDAMLDKYMKQEISKDDLQKYYKDSAQDSGGWSNLLGVISSLMLELRNWAAAVNEQSVEIRRLQREKAAN